MPYQGCFGASRESLSSEKPVDRVRKMQLALEHAAGIVPGKDRQTA